MPEYRRARLAGGTYFFTVVTHLRRPILTTPLALASLGYAFRRVRAIRPFACVATCVLPDHLHAIFTLPEGDRDYPARWAAIKALFTRRLRNASVGEGPRSRSRMRRGERGIWQRRFWEHVVCDEDDLRRHVDYIHFNPVKHGYVSRPSDWPWSSFRRYVRQGWYDPRWGESEPDDVEVGVSAGE